MDVIKIVINFIFIIAMTFVQLLVLDFTVEADVYYSSPVIEQDVSKMSNFEFISMGRKYLPLEPAGNKFDFADIDVDTEGNIYLSQSVPGSSSQGQAKLSKISYYGALTELLTDPGAFYPECLVVDDKTNRIYMGNGINGYLQIYNKQNPSVATKATKVLRQYSTINGSNNLNTNDGMDLGPNGDLFLIQNEAIWSARSGHRFETVNFSNTLEFAITPTGYPPYSELGHVRDISVNRMGRAYLADDYRPGSMGGGDVEVYNGLAPRYGAWDPIKRLNAENTLNYVRKVAADGFGNVYAVDQHYSTHQYRINIIADNNTLLKRIDLPNSNDDYIAVNSAVLNPSGDLLVLKYVTPDTFQPFIETFALRQIIRPGETQIISVNVYDKDGFSPELYTTTADPSPMEVKSITNKGNGNYDIAVTAPSSTGLKDVRLVVKGYGGSTERIIHFNVRSGGMSDPPPLPPCAEECKIYEYSFEAQTGPATIDVDLESVFVEVYHNADVTALVADFTLHPGAEAYIGDILQESGETANDFTDPVTYEVRSEDGETTHYWTVYVTKATPPIELLAAKVNQASELNEGAYTPESWEALATALDTAQGVLDNEDAMPEDIDTAMADLIAAMDALFRMVTGGTVNVPIGVDVIETPLPGEIIGGVPVGPVVTISGTLGNDTPVTFKLADPLPEGVSISQVSLYKWVSDRWIYSDADIEEDINGVITVSFTTNQSFVFAVLADTIPPADISVIGLSRDANSTTLSFSAIDDLSRVAGFYLYMDNQPVGKLIYLTPTEGDATYTISDLSSRTTYTFKAVAEDHVGNQSEFSDELSVTTSSSGGGGSSDRPSSLAPSATDPAAVILGRTAVTKTISTTTDGKTMETFTVKADAVNEIAKAKSSGKIKLEIVVDSSATALTSITIPNDVTKEAIGMSIAISTPNATLELPAALVEAYAQAGEALSFTVERGDAAVTSAQMNGISGAEGATILGTPTLIKTSIVGNTTVTLPLVGITYPDDPEERASFLKSLSVFAIHSDGMKQVITGTVVYDGDGKPTGIKFMVDKFSTFTVIQVAAKSMRVVTLTVGKINATVNGQPYILDAKPFINLRQNRTLVPMRFITEALGAQVEWKEAPQLVIITDGDTEIILTVGSEKVLVNGQEVTLDCPVELRQPGRTFIPMRFVSETLGATVNWDANTQEITITR